MVKDVNLFGEEIEKKFLLRDKYIEPPFSILDTKGGAWRNRKAKWKKLGIKSEVGRAEGLTFKMSIDEYRKKDDDYLSKQKEDFNTSVFDPVLCEILYRWFVPDTINAFKKAGLQYYNEAILLNPVASASMRADKQFSAGKKLVKIHQNVLIFKK